MHPTNIARCPACGARFRVKAEYAGRPGKCAKCGHVFLIACEDDVYALAPQTSDQGSESTPEETPEAPAAGGSDVLDDAGRPRQTPSKAQPLSGEHRETPPLHRYCGHCGAPVAEDAVVCVRCGFDRRTHQCHGNVERSSGDFGTMSNSYPPPAEWPGTAKPVLIWLIAILVPLALLWRGVADWQSYGSSRYIVSIPCQIVLLGWLAICIGLLRRSALAYRLGLVLLPCSAGLIWLLSMLSHQAPSAWPSTAVLVVVAVLVPVFWLQPGAKRYVGLSCPACDSVSVGAGDLLFAKRLCHGCGATFDETGAVYESSPAERSAMRAALQGSRAVGLPVSGERPTGNVRSLRDFSIVATIILVLNCVYLPAWLLIRVAIRNKFPPGSLLLGAYWGSLALSLCLMLLLGVGMLFWIYRTHREIRHYTAGNYAISPGLALALGLIPVFNWFWVVFLMYRLARTVRGYLRYPGMNPSPGLVLTLAVVQIALSVVAWIFRVDLFGPACLLQVQAMKSVQEGLNALWTDERAGLPTLPTWLSSGND